MLESICRPAMQRYLGALISGASDDEIKAAKNALEECLSHYAPSVAQALIHQMERFRDCIMAGGSLVDCLGPGVPGPSFPLIPIPGECRIRTEAINKEIFSDMDKAMAISTALENVLKKAGIRFSEDETFVVTFHAAKRPEYVSEILSAEAQPGLTGSGPRTTFMMAPKIMKQVMQTVERDKIH